MWKVRCAFWNVLLAVKFKAAKPLVVSPPGGDNQPVTAVPFASRYPDIPIAGIFVAGRVPDDESNRWALLFCKVQAWLARVFSPMEAHSPPISTDPVAALDVAYPRIHRRLYQAPVRPPEFGGGIDLAGLAVASPYSSYLTVDGDAGFQWDLRDMERFECHPGLRAPFALVEFVPDSSETGLRASRIDCELGSCNPGDPDWDRAVRLATCAVTTHMSLVRHFCWIHLVVGGPLAIVTHNCLSASHPLRRLLRPHVYATHLGNQLVTIVQMGHGGDFESTFSFTHAGMCELFEATCGQFDLRMIEPDVDATRRGVADLVSHTPLLENRRALMSVIRGHVTRYLALYFDSDGALASDPAFAQWLAQMASLLPGGVTELAGSPVTLGGAAVLLSTLIYMTTVEHEIVGSGLWDYQLWSDAQPTSVDRGGRGQPRDVYQRLVNANFNLNVHRTLLINDFSPLALDERGADAFRQFHDDLVRLQRTMDGDPVTCWRIEPKMLKANINY